jgi:mono/diheme cytochrome c family protein
MAMHRVLWFLGGVLAAAVVLLLVALVTLRGAGGFSAADQPSAMERWLAGKSRSMAIPAEARNRPNPVPDSPEALDEARAHWADHCAICHANNGSGDIQMGHHMYPPAPDMREAGTQNKTDGEIFWAIQNGVRMTGMPAWGASGHDEEDSWKLVRFIRHLPHLSPQEELDMRKLNPKSPEESKEEQEEKDFLNGATPHEATPHRH